MPFQYSRTDRLNEEVRREVDRVIREEVSDPRVAGTFSITRVEVTRDLRYAKVFVSVLEPEFRAPLIAALKGAAGFIRHEMGKRVQLHFTPELLFELDTNIEYGARMASLIDTVIASEKNTEKNSEKNSEKDNETIDEQDGASGAPSASNEDA